MNTNQNEQPDWTDNLNPGTLYRVVYSPTSFEYVILRGDVVERFSSLKQARLHIGQADAPVEILRVW